MGTEHVYTNEYPITVYCSLFIPFYVRSTSVHVTCLCLIVWEWNLLVIKDKPFSKQTTWTQNWYQINLVRCAFEIKTSFQFTNIQFQLQFNHCSSILVYLSKGECQRVYWSLTQTLYWARLGLHPSMYWKRIKLNGSLLFQSERPIYTSSDLVLVVNI